MGGSALKIAKTRRYNANEYSSLYYGDIYSKLVNLTKGSVRIALLPSYDQKETFGDMDILVEKGSYMTDGFQDKLKNIFQYSEIYKNGNVWSFDYKEFQIDLVFTKPDCWNTSLTYYSWNDLGNLMGRVANKLGVKYGHKGLEKKIYSEDRTRVLDEILLTRDIRRIFDFLGYDYDRFLLGFETLEDIFNYAVSSKYFAKELFHLENLDHQNRTRNRKRKTYMAFLDWLNTKQGFKLPVDFSSGTNWSRLIESFPELKLDERLVELKEKEAIHQQIKAKFNGKIIMELTGLEGKELGKFIQYVKDEFGEAFEDYMYRTDADIVKIDILGYFRAWRN
jgi:hypothetical protein